MELSKRAKGAWAVVVVVGSAVAALAAWTNALDTLLVKGRAWGPLLWRHVTPLLIPAVVIYGATALLLTALNEWRQRKGARDRQIRTETEMVLRTVKSLLWQMKSSVKDGVILYDDFYYPLVEVKAALVTAAVFERRSTVFNVINNMEKLCIQRLPAVPVGDLELFLSALQKWVARIEWELNPQEVGQPTDPFAPQR